MYWVKLYICIISEVVIVGVVFVVSRCWVVLVEMVIIYIDQVINVSLIVDMVSWISSDGVVLCFVVNRCVIVEVVFFSVSERGDII